MEEGEDVAKWGGRGKAFRGKRDVGVGKRQERVWQERGPGEEQHWGTLPHPVSHNMAVLDPAYKADHGDCAVYGTERVRKRRAAPGVRLSYKMPEHHLSSRQRRTTSSSGHCE